MSRLYLRATGIIIGLIIGAGMFALPYSFAKAGLFWGSFHFFATFILVYFLHHWYGEVAFYTNGTHRFAGYVEAYLGKKAKFFAALITVATYYGSLLVYGLLGGLFLKNFFDLFDGKGPFYFSIIFFAFGGLLSLFNFRKIGEINFYLTLPIFGFMGYLLWIAAPNIKAENFFTGGMFVSKDWFLPYGIWLFSLTGFSALPEARYIFTGEKTIKRFRSVITASLATSAVLYLVFVFVVLGSSGADTTQDALLGIKNIIGQKALAAGSAIGFLAVFTSYLALAVGLKGLFVYDYKMNKIPAWLLATTPPFAIFLLGASDFARTLGIIGSLGMGSLGFFIILMRRKMAERLAGADEGDKVADIDGSLVKMRPKLEMAILICVLGAVFYDIWKILGH